MTLTIDENAAAFGLFHLQYSALDETITRTVLAFARAEGQPRSEKDVRGDKLGRKVDSLKSVIRTLKMRWAAGTLPPEFREINVAFNNIDDVKKWRNDRAHARVVFTPGASLVDKTGEPLRIIYNDCVAQIEKAQAAMDELATTSRYFTTALRQKPLVESMKKTMLALRKTQES